MDSSRVQGHDLRSLASPSLVLIFIVAIQISVFVQRTKSGLVILAVYVDDILLTESDSAGLVETKENLKCHFVTKNMGKSKYFLGIEVAYQKYGILLSQRKYVMDLLEETELLGVETC